MAETKLTIIIPVYNVEAYLPQCLNSVLAQSLPDIEIILVNDGSTDNSLAICLEYAKDNKNIIIINQANQGLSAARNAGLEAAHGDYIGFVDSDDFIDRHMFQNLYESVISDGSDIGICAYQRVDDLDSPIGLPGTFPANIISSTEALENLFSSDYVYFTIACNKILARSLFSDNRFPVGKVFEDGYAAFRYYHKAKKISCTSYLGYFYRDRVGSITNSSLGAKSLDAVDANADAFVFLKENAYEGLAQKALAKYTACVFDKLKLLDLSQADIGLRFKSLHGDFKAFFPDILKCSALSFKEKTLASSFRLSPALCKKLMAVRGL